MTEAEAEMLTAKVFAIWPTPKPDTLTMEVYREYLLKMPLVACALEAVDNLATSETYRPPIALIVEDYNRLKPKYQPPALKEPPMTEEQRQENYRQAKALVERLSKSNEMEGS